MGGPVYHYDPSLISAVKLPAYYDKTLFIFEWSRRWIKEVKLDDNGNLLKINPFMPTTTFTRPIDMTVGPDGAIYLLEWGGTFGGNNADAQLARIEYTGAPTCGLDADNDGVPDCDDACPSTPAAALVGPDGCPSTGTIPAASGQTIVVLTVALLLAGAFALNRCRVSGMPH
jgi:hypothetical protein